MSMVKIGDIWHLYKLVSANQKLAQKRHPMFEQNMAVKVFVYIFVSFWAIYLMFFGVAFYFMFKDASIEAYDMINGGAMFFLVTDFLVRFGLQETPAQEIKPYKLLPVSETPLLNIFLVRLGLSPYNLFWFFFLVPFGLLSVPLFHGILGLMGFLLGWWVLFVFNSYWYLLWRTYINKSLLNVVFPLIIYAALIYFGYFYSEENEWLFKFFMELGQGFMSFDLFAYIGVFLSSLLLYYINLRMQHSLVYKEISKADVSANIKAVKLEFLNSFGNVGQYMKLEVMSIMRNQVVRKQFLVGLSYMILLSALFAFTDVYDELPFMRVFICVYCFACLGVMTLTSVMCAEGNYLDGLMSRKESVLSLLQAKYYFNCILLLFPAAIIVMPLAEGKLELVEALGCMFFTTGVIFPFLFQLAVYNNTTLHLNERLTKSGRSTKAQTIVSMAALFLPMLLMYVLMSVFTSFIASAIMLAIGLIGTLLHPFWLKNIYKRFMVRRYVNMVGFRDSIQN